MNLSVIIITAERVEVLRRCVEALGPELAPNDEIVIVSASRPCEGPHGPPPEKVLEASDARIRVVRSDVRSMTHQRNLGIRAARFDIVAFVDDDAFVQPGWRNTMMDAFGDATVASVVGKETLRGFERHDDARKPGVCWDGRILPLTHYSGEARTDVDFGQGCNMAFRKASLETIGGFDERFIVKADGEESDAFERLRRHGGRIVYEPRMAVMHEPAAPVGYTRGAFDWRAVYYNRRNYAYFLTKHYPLRLPWFGFLFWETTAFFGRSVSRAVTMTLHSAWVWLASVAGKLVGVWLGLKRRL